MANETQPLSSVVNFQTRGIYAAGPVSPRNDPVLLNATLPTIYPVLSGGGAGPAPPSTRSYGGAG